MNVCLSKRQVGLEHVSFLGQPLESTCSCPVLFKGCFSRVILKVSAAVKQVLSNSCLGSGTSWAQRTEDVGRFDGEGKLRAGALGAGRTLSAPWSLGLDQAELHIALALDESSIQGGFSWCLSRYSVTGGEKSLYWGNMWKPCRLLSALGGRRGQRSRGEAASGLHLRASGRVPPAFSLLRSQALTLASHVNSSSSHLYSFSKSHIC